MLKQKKSLGQNFLRDKSVVLAMADSGEAKNGDVVLEIGPGEGVLTTELLSRGSRVICIEKDDRLIPILSEKFKNQISSGQLEIIHKDVLLFDILKYPVFSKESYKVIANIPYYITGAILRKFLETKPRPSSVTILVQREVAERAIAYDGKESILSLSVKIFGLPKKIRNVPPGAFVPPPTIDSSILSIQNIYPRVDQNLLGSYFKLVKAGFSSKRKKLSSNLKSVLENPKDVMLRVGIDENARAEDVSFEKWCELAKIAKL
jgi:16S rRNA (adenine1518-N6/adenine1519-N6)-dimethyltransferase